MIERDIQLCRETRGRYHVAHISTARAVELVRRAKAQELPVTAEVSPHHLTLTDEACAEADPSTKMHPPLRTAIDVEACRNGLLDGTIDCIATDHAPHTAEEKAAGFLKAPPGIVGLETAVGVTARAMIASGLADWPQLVAWFTRGPAAVLGARTRMIEPGEPADLALLDPQAVWVVDPQDFLSSGRNTPFGGWKLAGRPVGTVSGSRMSIAGSAELKLSNPPTDNS
jgi:dihydroorotase